MRKVLVLVVAFCLLMAGLQLALADTVKSDTRKREWERLIKLKELVNLRTENSRTFLEKDGRKTTFLSSAPLNYQGSDGKYYPIDTNLVSEDISGLKTSQRTKGPYFRHKALKNVLKAQFADNSDDGILLEHGKDKIQFIIKHKNRRKAVINKNKVRYKNVFDDCDLEFTTLPGVVKDELIFRKVPSTPIISYKVNFNGLKPKTGKDGTIHLINTEGKTVFDLLPSVMYEKGNKKSLRRIDTRFHWEKGELYCDLILDMKWLKDKRRKYPVVIDPTLVSSGTEWKRFLLHTPVSDLNITCEINVDGPDWKGYFSTSYDNLYASFTDLEREPYIYFNEKSGDYYDKKTVKSIAGHDYEVVVHGGKSNQYILFWEDPSYGAATAKITYDALFSQELRNGKNSFNTTVETDVITKDIRVKYPQTIQFNYVEGFQILRMDPDGNGTSQAISQGTLSLQKDTIYRLRLSPQRSGNSVLHSRVEIKFPYLTADYESKIVLGTDPGYIDSTFKVPSHSKLLLDYQIPENEVPTGSIVGYPSMKVYSDSGLVIYQKQFRSQYYNNGIIGGDIIDLLKETPYHLLISRGKDGKGGWGHINVTVHHQQNSPESTVANLTLIDETGAPVTNGFAKNSFKLRFDYQDNPEENNSLKEYILVVQKTGNNPVYYKFDGLNIRNGQVIIPKTIGNLGLAGGDRVTCNIVKAWDGFDSSDTDAKGCIFTVDNQAPTITRFKETFYENNKVDLECLAEDNVNGSGLNSRVLTWKIDDGQLNQVTLDDHTTSYSLSNLPYNAKIEVSLTAIDNIGNTAVQTKTLYTYPERSELVAPVQIIGTSASKYQTTLKIAKVQATLYRVERFRDHISTDTRDYDTGYLNAAALSSLKSGPPSVSIISPANGTTVHRPANITITANAVDVDGTIHKVEFYSGTVLIGTVTAPPYQITWNNVPLGTYNLTAKATDNDGLTTVSSPVQITVANIQPAVSITGGVTANGTTVTINATASDNDGGIQRVEFYINDTLLGSDTTAPYGYSFNWTYPSDTSYVLTAKAVDNDGGIATSNPVNIRRNYLSRQVCEQVCQTLTRRECRTESYQECHWVCDFWLIFCWSGHDECHPVYYQVCEDVPYTECHTECHDEFYYEFAITNGTTPASSPAPTPAPTTTPPGPVSDGIRDCYEIPDRPAQKHQKYIYRIYTKNGDKELFQDSAAIPVANNAPEFAGIQPDQGSTTYSNGIINIIPQVIDRDDDDLRFSYTITGPDSRSSGETTKREWTFGSLSAPVQDGQYTWSVTVKDEVDAELTATGIVIVEKSYPTASFKINNNALYTSNQTVNLTITDVSANVNRIEIANSESGPWTSIGMNPSVNWTLSNGDGQKTVYMRVFNQAGVQGDQIIRRSIILDRQGPDLAGVNFITQGDNGKVHFSWSGGSDPISGLSTKVNIQKSENGQWLDYQTGYENSGIEIPAAGPNVPVTIRVQFIDNAGNVSAWSGPVTAYTFAAKVTKEMVTATSGYSTVEGHFIGLKLNAAQNTRYSIECIQNPGGGYNGPLTPGSDGTIVLTNAGLKPHATYKYRILSYNVANEVTTGEEFAVTLSNNFIAAPAGAAPSGFICRNWTGFDFSTDFSNSDPDGDILSVEYYLSNDGVDYIKLAAPYVTDLINGTTYWWYAIISDGYGGTCQTMPVSFVPDLTVPEITVDNTSVQYALEHKVKIQAIDEVSGLASLKYSLNGSPLMDLTGEIIIRTQGTNNLYVEATDKAGNVAIYSHAYYIDLTPPATLGVQFLLPRKDDVSLASDVQIPVRWNAADPETGIAQFKYQWSTDSTGCDPGNMQSLALLDQQDTYQTILPGDFEDGKTYYLYIQAQNHLGLTGPIVRSGRLLYDHTAPIVKIAELSGGTLFSGQYYLTNLSQLGVAVEASDPDSGIIKTEFALAEDLNGEIAQWHNTLNELKGNVTVNHGKLYYLVVRAVNGTQLTAIAYSEPIFIETTGPELTVETSSAQPDTGVYTARIQTRDPETMVTGLQYCIGTAPAKADLSTGLPGTENGWFSVNYPDQIYELRHYAGIPVGLTYYITVKATNVAGLITTTSSSGTLVSGPSVTAPEVSDDGYYTSEKTSLHFKWNFAASLKQIRGYEYQIRSSQGVIKSWTGYDPGDIQIQAVTPVSLLVTGLNLVNNTQYYCDVRAKYDDGNYSGIGSSDGILVDYTIPTITSFTAPAYAGSKGVKLDWQAADPESGVKCYLGLGMNPGEMDVTKGWISIGNLKTYQISVDSTGVPIQFENGRKYYATLMVENGSGLAVQQTSPAITIDLTPPPTPVVLDDGSYTNRADRLRANWKWTKPDPESGIREYLYTITTKRALSGGEFWFSNETETDIEFTNLNLTQGKTYYVVVKSVNNAGIESEPGFSNGILVDTTAPSPPLAVDSGDYSLSNNNLRVDLLASDAESGIEGYRLSLGTLDEPDKVFGEREILTESGLEHLDLDGLNLEEGQIYFFTVKAINRSSLISLETSSDGIMVDSKRPKVAKITVQARYLSDPSRIAFDWQAENSPSGIIAAQYAISDNPNGSNLAWQDLDLSGTKVVSGLNLNDGTTYYVYVRVQNRAQAENTPDVWSLVAKSDPLTIDQTPPEIIKINAPAFASQHFLLQWEGKDVTSGIVEYRYAVGSDRGATDLTGGWISLKTSDTSISFYRDDLPLGDKHSCYISVKAKNGAGLWSEVYKTDAIRTDLTPPVITKLEYGSGYLRSRDTIKTIIWEANDPDTGIAAYRIGMVEEKKNDCLTGAQRVPTDQTGGTIDLTGLTLEEGRTYYIALQIQNSVGDWSEVRYSQGITVDTIAPSVRVVDSAPELVTNSGELEIPVRVSEPCTLKVTLVYPNGREDVMDVSVPADIYRYHFSQTMEGRYTLSLTPTDPAGNPGDTFNQVIRLNAKPFANIGPDLKVTKGTTVHFKPEVSDSDGTVVEYAWNFGGSNGDPDNTSTEANPYHTFKELGTYEVTLIVKDNDGKWSNYGDETRKAKCSVEVTNTYSGTLQLDEYWEGEIMITGNVIVPQGITLTIRPGTKIDFLGSYQILVNGKIIIDGTPDNQVMVGADTYWNGIRLEKADPGSAIRNATIRGASVGMVIYESSASITGSTFTGNDIGLHLVHSGPLVQGCVFQGNTIYGVKEDDSAQPAVIDCRFLGNGAADYYEDQRGIISIDTLNKTNGNSGNQ